MPFNSTNIINEKSTLWFIILVGTILRVYNTFEIPFTHDELSAIMRLQYNSFTELINYGVKVDGHPALIQVFLYYWTHLFGLDEITVKIPFILLGIASIPLSYTITKKWFNGTSALLVASYIATLQFPVMFSQIARPYISGMFFILVLSYYWTEFLFNTKHSKWSIAGLIIFASLSTYNHYFSFMLAGIIGVTGFFFVTKRNAIQYLLAFLTVGVIFIPHLNIFFYQLNIQGLDWLSTPTISFFTEHLKFIFHFNTLVYLLILGLFVFGLLQSKKIQFNKFQIVSLIWFLAPIIIGVTYSIYIKPVVQYSTLIFSFPFLIIFILSWIKPLKPVVQVALVSLILLINTSTLIVGRSYYDVFYHQPFEEFSNLTNKFINGSFTDSVPTNFEIIYGDNPKYLNFYFKDQNPNQEYTSHFNTDVSPVKFKEKIANSQAEYLILGNINPSLVLIAKEFFPTLVRLENGLNYTYYILGKKANETHLVKETVYFNNNLNFEKENHLWPEYRRELDWDNYILKLDSTQEWGPNLKLKLNEYTNSRHALVQVKLDFKSKELSHGLIVVSLTRGDQNISWNAAELDPYTDTNTLNQWQRAYFSIDLTPSFTNSDQFTNVELSVYFWNKEKKSIAIDNFEVKLIEGNPYIYGTIQPID